MIKTVLVPLDGSDLAAEALSYAVPIAERHSAEMHLVFVIPHDAPASDDDRAREYLQSVADSLSQKAQAHVRIGQAADEIINASDELEDPLVVMTTHGRTGIGRWIYGSVADKVVHAASAPVLLLRSGSELAPGESIKKIVISLDGSVYSEAALPFAKSMTKAFDAELHVVRVAETANLYTSLGYEAYAPGAGQPMADVAEHMINDVKKYIADVSAELKEEGYQVQGVVLEGFAGDELLGYEEREQPELMIMATQGRSGFNRFIFGSVAERVLKNGQVPVLMVQPSGSLEEDA